jgi:type I restriction enzyme, S subunit
MRLRLYFNQLGQIKVPVPTIEEQNEIISFIDCEKARIDKAITKIQKEIDLLQEYRTALISEVVTGKIDVREEVAVWT